MWGFGGKFSCCRGTLQNLATILFVKYLCLGLVTELNVEGRHAGQIPQLAEVTLPFSPLGCHNQAQLTASPGIVKSQLVASLPSETTNYGKKSLQGAAPSYSPVRASSLHYRSLNTVEQIYSNLTELSNSSVSNSALAPPVGNVPHAVASSSSVPTGFSQPPVPPQSGCCELNMIQRRGYRECNCVYPVMVELFLQNVSLISNWSNEFLKELASQLNLRTNQFEINNFYVVGSSGLNITMDIAPHSGTSFSQRRVNALNRSLAKHKVHIRADLVGDYKLLNFTWFRPPAPSPAPIMSSVALPPTVPKIPFSKSDNRDKDHSNLLAIVGFCVGALLFIILIMLIICLCTYCKEKNVPQEVEVKPRTVDTLTSEESLRRPNSTRFLAYEELKGATNNFEPASLLGEGGFGRVFKGVLNDGTAVAIKKLTSGGHQGDKEFLVEVEMLSRLHHRNLVKLVGYYASHDAAQNLLCYELVPNGSLESWLHGPLGANCPLGWDTRMKIALDAARGLAYLHEDSQPCVIHRDFKASNILLDNSFVAKVSDFGLAKQAPEGRANHLSTRVMGTFGYVAPEYAMTGHLLVKSDVYSYGVVLLELLTGRRPVDMSQPSGQENLVTWARPILRDKDRLEELADPRLQGKYPKDDFLRVCTIAAACVAAEANQRPTMGEVVQSLKMVQRVSDYQDSSPTPTARPNNKNSTYESDGTSSMFSSGPFSGLSLFENEIISGTAVVSEDLHEGR